MKKKILILNGPNLNLLHKRDKSIYGDLSLEKIHHDCEKLAAELDLEISFKQSNSEGEIVGEIQDAIDNEKILDIMYDGGSIPDVKRPVRPKRVYTASNGKQILEAICLIDDKLKRFNLDKVKVIS